MFRTKVTRNTEAPTHLCEYLVWVENSKRSLPETIFENNISLFFEKQRKQYFFISKEIPISSSGFGIEREKFLSELNNGLLVRENIMRHTLLFARAIFFSKILL